MIMRIKILFALTLLLSGSSLWAQQQFAGEFGCPVYVPNAFTPNNDQVNDLFVIRLGEDCQVEQAQMRIFDRWGRMVYDSENAREALSWDGQYKNMILPAGVYMMDLRLELFNHQTKEFSTFEKRSSVVLVR